MKLFTSLILVALIASAFAVPTNKLTTSSRLTGPTVAEKEAQAKRIQEIVKENGGCSLNMCFALDGSGSISLVEYDLQKDFVNQVVVALSGNPREAAAVQYGLDNIEIRPLTSNIPDFLRAVDADESQQAPTTFMAGGIAYCLRQLRDQDGDANKMVVIGDGDSNFGGDPVPLANLFRARIGKVCSIGVRFPDTKKQTLIDVAGDSSNVFTVADYLGLFDIVEDLVKQMCGIDN